MQAFLFDYPVQYLNFWLPALLMTVFLILLFYSYRIIVRKTFPVSKTAWAALVLLLCLAGFLRLFWAPHTHYVFDDELYHIEIARNMQERQAYLIDNSDLISDGRDEARPTWMPVFHFCLSLVFRLFGAADSAVFIFNAIIGTLTVLLFYMLGRVLFEKDSTALILAGLICLYPLHVKMSGGGNLEPLSLLFLALSLITLALNEKTETGYLALGLLTLVVSTLAVMTRIENGIVAAPTFILVILKAARYPRKSHRVALYIIGAILALICLYELAYSYLSYSAWRQGVGDIYPLSALKFLVADPLNPVILPVLAVIGAAFLWKKEKKTVLFLLYCWILYVIAYTLVQGVDISRVDSDRFNLNLSLFILILTAGALHYFLNELKPAGMGRTLALLSGVIFLAGFVWSMDDIKRHIWPERAAEVEFVKEAAVKLPADSLICSESAVYVRSLTSLRTTRPEWLPAAPSMLNRPLIFYRSFSWKQSPENWEARLAERYRFEPLQVTQIGGDQLGFFAMRPR